MSKKECPSCAMMVDSKNKICPICDYEFTSSGTGRKWFILFLLAVFLFSAFYGIVARWF